MPKNEMMNERKRARTSFHYICLSFISFITLQIIHQKEGNVIQW